ncbi:group III truncated hemoglobin [Rhabdothermincola sediminis]|uniref:group III truncated hemoglobin n=1 Tax=Rhabdothermincola sediminis TaxID=2751370 RepID=UPI001AA056BD|nr:group III truncated hemoglobin [Rhabdothermincola sediminis]
MTSEPTPRDLDIREHVELLVHAFYRDVATDDLLGPIFEGMGVDWPAHIATLTDFWSWQLLGERGYTGNPLRAHEPAHQRFPFTDAHFERWLELFAATVDAHFEGPRAATAKQRAAKMAAALRRFLAGEEAAGHAPVVPFLARRAGGPGPGTERSSAPHPRGFSQPAR